MLCLCLYTVITVYCGLGVHQTLCIDALTFYLMHLR